MEYFIISLSKDVKYPIKIKFNDINTIDKEYYDNLKEQKLNLLDDLKVVYYSGEEKEECCDVIIDPVFMISDKIKRLLNLYDENIEYKGMQIYSLDENVKQYPLYWIPLLEEIDCLNQNSKILPNGLIENLVLDFDKINNKHIFKISNIVEERIIISLTLAESILRRIPYGVSFFKVEVI